MKAIYAGSFDPPTTGPDAKSTVFKINVWDWNPGKIEYNSVEEMVQVGWMVD